MPVFEYGQDEIDYLKGKDRVLGVYIDQIGIIRREVTPDLYAALVNSIIGQQISTKAWLTVWTRMKERLGDITPDNMLQYSCEEIQACGITMKKANYIRDAAEKVRNREIDLDALCHLPDKDVAGQLSRLKGIGIWTAEMLMIFSMQRKDIFSFDDLAIHRGLRMVYRHKKITRELFEKYRRRYSPYASIASLYLWKISTGACGLTDCAPTGARRKRNPKPLK